MLSTGLNNVHMECIYFFNLCRYISKLHIAPTPRKMGKGQENDDDDDDDIQINPVPRCSQKLNFLVRIGLPIITDATFAILGFL